MTRRRTNAKEELDDYAQARLKLSKRLAERLADLTCARTSAPLGARYASAGHPQTESTKATEPSSEPATSALGDDHPTQKHNDDDNATSTTTSMTTSAGDLCEPAEQSE